LLTEGVVAQPAIEITQEPSPLPDIEMSQPKKRFVEELEVEEVASDDKIARDFFPGETKQLTKTKMNIS
jgi:hypothetical protein